MSMHPEELGDLGLAHLAGRDGQSQIDQALFVVIDFDVVKGKEHNGGRGSSSLVAVKERMVLDNMEEVSRRHLEDVTMKVLTTVRSLRSGDGRLEQAYVANTIRASVVFDQTAVQSQGVFQVQKHWCRHELLRQLLHRVAEPFVNHRHGIVKLLLVLGIAHRRQDERTAIGDDLKRCIGGRLNQFKDRLIDHQRVTVAVFGQCFDHRGYPN